jgi:hypothetical protein
LGLKEDFYFFHDLKHDAVLLARYINGGRRPWRIADVQQVLWAPVNFILGMARGGARLVQGSPPPQPAAAARELEDGETTIGRQHPPRPTALPAQPSPPRQRQEEGQEGSDVGEVVEGRATHKAAINIAVEVEEGMAELEGASTNAGTEHSGRGGGNSEPLLLCSADSVHRGTDRAEHQA